MESNILIHLEETVIKVDIMYPVISILFHDFLKKAGKTRLFSFSRKRIHIWSCFFCCFLENMTY